MRSGAALAILAALSACSKSSAPAPEQPLQVIEGFTVSQADHGSRLWTMEGASAVLAEDAKQVAAVSPRLKFFKGGRQVTEVTSGSGVLRTDTNDVRLSSAVVVRSLDEDSVLKTDELLWDSKKNKYVTDQEVTITRPEGVLHGKGLEASSDLGEIKIHHQTSVIEKGARP